MILRDIEADDPRWAESLYIPDFHAHLQAAKNGTEFPDPVNTMSQKKVSFLRHWMTSGWLIWHTHPRIQLTRRGFRRMKKISYFVIVLFVLLCLYFLFSTIFTSHTITPNHLAVTLTPATESERMALTQAQAEEQNTSVLQTQASLTPLMKPRDAENTVLNIKTIK